MAAILTRCPRTDRPIPTGLDTSMVVFESLPKVPIPVRCQACGNEHYWTRSTAWVAEETLAEKSEATNRRKESNS